MLGKTKKWELKKELPSHFTFLALDLFPFKKYGHYNEPGYKLEAEEIFKKIKKLQKSNNLN